MIALGTSQVGKAWNQARRFVEETSVGSDLTVFFSKENRVTPVPNPPSKWLVYKLWFRRNTHLVHHRSLPAGRSSIRCRFGPQDLG